MDNYGYLYFGLLRNHAVCRWDSYRPFTLDNQQVIAKDDAHIQWTDGELKIDIFHINYSYFFHDHFCVCVCVLGMGFDENGFLYVVVNRLHNFVAGRLREDEVNFRILRSKTGTLSYVHTGRPSVEENLLNIGGGGPIYEIHDNTLGSGFISSTTPISLGSIGGQYYNNSATHYQITTTLSMVSVVIAVFVKYFI